MTQQTAGAQEVLTQIQHVVNREFQPIIGPFKGKYLAEEIRKAKPRRVLEVGTLIGYSTILIANELGKDAEVVSIEIHPEEVEVAQQNILRANLTDKIRIITGNALEVIPTLQGQFEFAFIDAEKTEYYQYLKLAECKLVQGAVVFADNAGAFADQMSDYLDYVRNSGKYQSRYIAVGDDGVEISVKL